MGIFYSCNRMKKKERKEEDVRINKINYFMKMLNS